MQSVKPQWEQRGAVFVCEKCYKERIPDESPETAARIGDFNLRSWLKAQCKETFGKSMRVVNSGCLDVCGKETVTVALIPNDIEKRTVVALDPIDDKEALLELVRKTFA